MRYTKSEIEGMFNRLLKATHKIRGVDGGYRVDGGWYLDYVSEYGGYVIEQAEENGGISHPFGCIRRTGKEMYLSLLMTAQALEDINYKQRDKT